MDHSSMNSFCGTNNNNKLKFNNTAFKIKLILSSVIMTGEIITAYLVITG